MRLTRSTAFAVIVLAVAVWAELLIRRTSGGDYVFITLGLAVATVALSGGFWLSVVAIATAALASDYFILGPGTLLSFGNPVEAVALAAFVGGWLVVCALLHRVHRRSRRASEACIAAQRTAAQATRVAQLTATLGRARSADGVIEASIQEPLHGLGADAAMLLLVNEDASAATVAHAVGYDSDLRVPDVAASLSTAGPIRDTVRRAAPVILESPHARAMEYAGLTDQKATNTYGATATVPLIVRGRVAAVIEVDFREARAFSQNDHEYLDTLAVHTGYALERTWEQESTRRARIEAEELRERADQELAHRQTIEQALRASETRYRALATRTTRLHAFTAALSEAVTMRGVTTAILQHGTIVVGATAGDVWLRTENGAQFETCSSCTATMSPGRIALEPGLCEADVVGRGQPLFISSWKESQEQYWRSASAAADAAYVSSAALPLRVGNAPAGVLRFDFSVPVNFDQDYQALLISVAQHCSQALDRARLYESAQRARAEAEAASRLKDDFLSTVSHELRTPLNAVLGWASMLRKTSIDSTLARRALQSIHDNATRQAKLIDDLLDVSRIVAGRATLDLQEIELTTVVAGVVESLIPVAVSNGVELHVAQCPSSVVTGDRRRLEQVFFNLIGNALKFTPAQGWIRIDTSLSDAAVRVSVKDSGIGIEPDFLPHVFERFRQADTTSTRTYGGLGLGLAIAKQLVEAQRGTIAVESAGSGQGATFTVQLPLRAASAPRQTTSDRSGRMISANAKRLDGTRVLVVDDEPDAREIMAYALNECGASVTSAGTAAEAFGLLVSDEFDVLIADIAMPVEDGCSLMRRVRACGDPRVAHIPAAAVTAHARPEERRDVLAAGFHMHVAKPIEPQELARAVGELARGGSDMALATC